MKRSCDFCGIEYEPKSPKSRFCSPRCRVRNHRSPASATVTPLPVRQDAPGGLVEALRAELAVNGMVDTVQGQQALALAARIESPAETGSGVASLSKELRVVMGELAGRVVADDPLDEIRARRLRKLAGVRRGG